MTQIVIICQGDWPGVNHATGKVLVQPVSRLDVVLRSVRRSAAAMGRPERRPAQSLKKVIRRAVFLDDHNDVLKSLDLPVGYSRSKQNQQQDFDDRFHRYFSFLVFMEVLAD